MQATIAEPIPSLNKGEAAIFRGLQESLAICGITDIALYSPPEWHRDDALRYPGVKVVSGFDLWDAANNFLEHPAARGRMHFFRAEGKLLLFSLLTRLSRALSARMFNDDFLDALAGADLIVAGHDGMLGYGHFWVVLAAKIMDKPIALYGGGNDFGGRSRKLRVRKYLQFMAEHALLLAVRDENTKAYFVKNGVDPARVHVIPDPAVLLKPCAEQRAAEILSREGVPVDPKVPLYGLIPVRGGIVAAKSFSHEPDRERKHALRVDLWKNIVERLMKTVDAHFVIIPHCMGPASSFDDRRMMQDLLGALPGRGGRLSAIRGEYSESEYKGILKACDFVLGERTHALIGAVSAATPCVALTVEEDLRMHQIIHAMFGRPAVNLNAPDMDALIGLLAEEWKNRSRTAAEMAKNAERIHEQAVKAALLLKEKIEAGRRSMARRGNGGGHEA